MFKVIRSIGRPITINGKVVKRDLLLTDTENKQVKELLKHHKDLSANTFDSEEVKEEMKEESKAGMSFPSATKDKGTES